MFFECVGVLAPNSDVTVAFVIAGGVRLALGCNYVYVFVVIIGSVLFLVVCIVLVLVSVLSGVMRCGVISVYIARALAIGVGLVLKIALSS